MFYVKKHHIFCNNATEYLYISNNQYIKYNILCCICVANVLHIVNVLQCCICCKIFKSP
jgi:hypothetical protein